MTRENIEILCDMLEKRGWGKGLRLWLLDAYQRGYQRGFQEGYEEAIRERVLKMIRRGLDDELILEMTRISPETLAGLRVSLRSEEKRVEDVEMLGS